MVTQLLGFGGEKHDDAVDALDLFDPRTGGRGDRATARALRLIVISSFFFGLLFFSFFVRGLDIDREDPISVWCLFLSVETY
jgi:hypothetical protein